MEYVSLTSTPNHADEWKYTYRDAEIKEEGFLEYMNQLLMTGEVAGLWSREELEGVLNDVRPTFKHECAGTVCM